MFTGVEIPFFKGLEYRLSLWEPSRAKRRPDASFPQQRSYPGCSATMHVPTTTTLHYTTQQHYTTQHHITATQQQQHYIATDREISTYTHAYTYTHTHTATQATPQDRYLQFFKLQFVCIFCIMIIHNCIDD
jgi:hypothetical protein